MKIFTEASALPVGHWFAIGMEGLDGNINWGGMQICKHEGGGLWSDDNGNLISDAWDPILQMSVSINSADAYMQQ